MACFTISYDLIKHKNYDLLESGINNVSDGRCTKILETVWVVISNYDKSKDVRDYLQKYVDNDDKLFVIKCGDSVTSWATLRVNKDATDWLKKH